MFSLPHSPFGAQREEISYYPAQATESARIQCLTCLGDGETGFLLVGPDGSGKSTLLNLILNHPARAQEILWVPPTESLTGKELLQALLFDCRLPIEGQEMELRLRLMDHLATLLGSGKNIWVVVDGIEKTSSGAMRELMTLVKVPGQKGRKIQLILTGTSRESGFGLDLTTACIPEVALKPWPAVELMDFICKRAGGTGSAGGKFPGKEWVHTLIPEGEGYPGPVLALLRHAWRLSGLGSNSFPNAESIQTARQARLTLPSGFRKESRWPLPENGDPVPMPFETGQAGLEEWMKDPQLSSLAWD